MEGPPPDRHPAQPHHDRAVQVGAGVALVAALQGQDGGGRGDTDLHGQGQQERPDGQSHQSKVVRTGFYPRKSISV